jgi:hypothetical protein
VAPDQRRAGRTALSIVLLVLVTGLVLIIAIRTARLTLRGQLLPPPPAPAIPPPIS